MSTKTVNADLTALLWPLSRLGEGLQDLARCAGLLPGQRRSTPLPGGVGGADDALTMGYQLAALAGGLGVEATPLDGPARTCWPRVLANLPAVLRLPAKAGHGALLIVAQKRRQLQLLTPHGELLDLPSDAVKHWVLTAHAPNTFATTQTLLDHMLAAQRPPNERFHASAALLDELAASIHLRGLWGLSLAPGEDALRTLAHAGVFTSLATLAALHAAQYALWIFSWWIVGRAALEGRAGHGWLWAWGLSLATIVALRLTGSKLQGEVAISAGALLKRRLTAGALHLDPDVIRAEGAGQLLGRVLDTEAIEGLAITGGLVGLLALIELVGAGIVLAFGCGSVTQPLLLLVWSGLVAWLGSRLLRAQRRWTAGRLALTHELVEKMTGHRTCLLQDTPGQRHAHADHLMEDYLTQSRIRDTRAAVLLTVAPRGWLVIGTLGAAVANTLGNPKPAALAVTLGGTLLAYNAYRKLTQGIASVGQARIAWARVRPLFCAARGNRSATWTPAVHGNATLPLLEAKDISYRYPQRPKAMCHPCSLHVYAGDRIVLEGASGAGKSTLGAILGGLKRPDSGLLLARGLDLATLGEVGWRRRVVVAPQFHDNHVLTGTLAFNLLMGRPLPPSPEDLDEAASLCRALGLGSLLEAMPAGLLQMVGESGWQLSHGERSRLFLARALLQGAPLVVLDESLAALDAATLRLCLEVLHERTTGVILIAHL